MTQITGKTSIHLFNLSNYYNRMVIRFDTLAEYEPYRVGSAVNNVNFKFGDSVDVTQIVEYPEGIAPNYLIVTENARDVILARYYIIEARLNSGKQYTLTLHRDLVADYYNEAINAPAFVEKATVEQGDPAIYNKEGITVNQIKQREILLKDETNCRWVVGYMPNNYSVSTPITAKAYVGAADINVSAIADWTYYDNTNLVSTPLPYLSNASDRIYRVAFRYGSGAYPYHTSGFRLPNVGLPVIATDVVNQITTGLTMDTSVSTSALDLAVLRSYYASSVYGYIRDNVTAYTGEHTSAETAQISALSGKVIKDTSTSKYYQIQVNSEPYIKTSPFMTGTGMYSTFNQNLFYDRSIYNFSTFRDAMTGTADNSTFSVTVTGTAYNLVLTEIVDTTYTVSIPDSATRTHLSDQPYDMFAIPMSSDLVIKNGAGSVYLLNTADNKTVVNCAIPLATAIAAQIGTDSVYDVQILPYCPIRQYILADGTFNVVNATANVDYTLISYTLGADTINANVVFFCRQSQFSLDVLLLDDADVSIFNPSDIKLSNECDVFRICSPNYASFFEFSAAMNGGVQYFNIDCNYRPFSPYIHVNPNFGGLYGSDFNDARGLICGGEFSLSQVSNAWANYQLNNKNWQQLHDRDIQNMEINNKLAATRQIINGITGMAGAAVGGTKAGGGGPVGLLTGGIAAAAAGINQTVNYTLSEIGRAEALDYKQDMYTMNLGNIQALPNTLTKVTALNANNKGYPFVEYYTCTPIEREAVANKLRYNGMTVNRIGTIAEFLKDELTYIKVKLIRQLEVRSDYHIINALAQELDKGVFIK